MSALSTELFNTAQSLQTVIGEYQSRGDAQSANAAGVLSQAVALFLMASTQENAHDASAALMQEAKTVAGIQTITTTTNAQTTRIAQQVARATETISIGTNILTIIAGAANPLAVLPTITKVVSELNA